MLHSEINPGYVWGELTVESGGSGSESAVSRLPLLVHIP